MQPLIGITLDNRDNNTASGKYEVAIAYSHAITHPPAPGSPPGPPGPPGTLGPPKPLAASRLTPPGTPLLLPHEPQLAKKYAQLCDAFVLTGGVDPRVTQFGQTMHPKARPVDPARQKFELALLDAIGNKPVLGICLGMQLMALHAGWHLNQYLPDTLTNAAVHQNGNPHTLKFIARDSVLAPDESTPVASYHQQAVTPPRNSTPDITNLHPNHLRIVATAPDGTIEAIDDPTKPFYLGVQWHPERGNDAPINRGLFAKLIAAVPVATSK